MELNPEKCKVFFVNATEVEEAVMYEEISKLLPGIRKLDKSTFELLGAPIVDEGLERLMSSKIESIKLLTNRLKLLDVHPALCIFKKSVSVSTFLIPSLLEEVNEMFRSTLEIISNTKINVISWSQASLPLSFGGFGIRKATEIAYPAYLSSIYQSSDLSNSILEKYGLTILNHESQSLLDSLRNSLY